MRDHERIRGAKERADQYSVKRTEEQVGGGVAEKTRVGDGAAGSSSGSKWTPGSRGGDGSSVTSPRTAPERSRDQFERRDVECAGGGDGGGREAAESEGRRDGRRAR